MLKTLLNGCFAFIFLIIVVHCQRSDFTVPTDFTVDSNFTEAVPTNVNILVERPLYIVSSPENSITKTISIDTNILDLYLISGYNADDFSVTHLDGVDVGVLDTDSLTIDESTKTISGLIKLNQRLDFENPIDRGENSRDNDYEVAIFRVTSETSSNDFKLIVRITDAADPKKLEILIDSLHLDDVNQQRGLRELYLYEDSGAIAPILGDDSNNFLTSNLIEDIYVWGDVDAYTDLSQLYDQNDRVDAFLTATTINSNSKTYHRLIIDFTEELYIQKVAIRGRQLGGYYGFVFILRDKNDHIIYVHQVQNPIARGSGVDKSATSTYDFVANYAHFTPISDFNIKLNNSNFNVIENTTNIVSDNSFSVADGYEYERGVVSIEPGADVDKFNLNDLYFINNELIGLSFKTAPDAENEQDADRNNVYELGTVTITNVDGGKAKFPLSVNILNVPSVVVLITNHVDFTVNIHTSNVIEDLLDFVDLEVLSFSDMRLEYITYNYQLSGDDASYFKSEGNMIKTVDDFGFRSIYENDGEYNFQVTYVPDDNGASQVLEVRVRMDEPRWREITSSAPWARVNKNGFVAVVLNNGDILVMGGYSYESAVWQSSDGGDNWSKITDSPLWANRQVNISNNFNLSIDAVVANDNILVIGGEYKDDIYLSDDGGTNWTNVITSSPTWSYDNYLLQDRVSANSGGDTEILNVIEFTEQNQVVALNSGDILLMALYPDDLNVWSWINRDRGISWDRISMAPWEKSGEIASLADIRLVVLNNDDILCIVATTAVNGGGIWKSENGSGDWNVINTSSLPWEGRNNFQSVALPNNDVLILGGLRYPNGGLQFTNDVWLGKGVTNWTNITPNDHWGPRSDFEAIFVPNRGTLVMGGLAVVPNSKYYIRTNDVWLREEYNRHYRGN